MNLESFKNALQLEDCIGDKWYWPILSTMERFSIFDNERRQAAFLSQIFYESCGFKRLYESFDYTPEALSIFSSIPVWSRNQLGRHADELMVPRERQIQIANIAYANRHGNGGETSGDGWGYRGRGLIQITFKDNYYNLSKGIGIDLVENPDLICINNVVASDSAGWFWENNGCNYLADNDEFLLITKKITGPSMTGEIQRMEKWKYIKKSLGID